MGFLVGSTIVASRIRRGKGSTSDFIVFITYYAQVSNPFPSILSDSDTLRSYQLYFSLSQLGDVYRSIDQGLIDAEKLLDLLAEPSELVDAPGAKELVVENGEVEFGACSTNLAHYIPIIAFSQKMYPSPTMTQHLH